MTDPIVTAIAAIETHFKTEWAGRTFIEWPNTKGYIANTAAEYVEFNLQGIDSRNRAMGNGFSNLIKSIGLVAILVVGPRGKGERIVQTRATEALDIFENRKVSIVTFRAGAFTRVSDLNDPEVQYFVTVPFFFWR